MDNIKKITIKLIMIIFYLTWISNLILFATNMIKGTHEIDNIICITVGFIYYILKIYQYIGKRCNNGNTKKN